MLFFLWDLLLETEADEIVMPETVHGLVIKRVDGSQINIANMKKRRRHDPLVVKLYLGFFCFRE